MLSIPRLCATRRAGDLRGCGIKREIRIKIGVIFEGMGPSLLHKRNFAHKARAFFWWEIAPPCCRFVVYQFSEWRDDVDISELSYTQAQIDIIIGYCKIQFIKSACFEKDLFPDSHASGGDGANLPCQI